MSADWYRNKTWSASIEQAFNDKLRRARGKDQYMRIQASTLVRSHPQVALALLDRYFELPDAFDRAQAHVDRSTASIALGRIPDALDALEDPLAREAVFPNLLTEAYVAYPSLVADWCIRERYARAVELLLAH